MKRLPPVFFALGFAAVVLQAALVREMLAVFYGTELVVGIIFGSWLAWIGLGAAAGGRLAKNVPLVRPGFLVSTLLLAVLPFGQIALVRCVRVLLHAPAGEAVPLVPTLLFCAAVVSLPSFIIGFVFPLGSEWYLNAADVVGRGPGAPPKSRRATESAPYSASAGAARGVGWLYVCESLGFLAGGLTFTFVFAGRVSSFDALSVSGVLLVFACVFLLMGACRAPTPSRAACRATPIAAALAVAAALPFLRGLEGPTVAARWRSISPASRLVRTVDSKYENISISEDAGQYSVYGNGGYRFSFPDRYYYARIAHFLLAQHPAPKRALVLGGGAVGLACEMLLQPLERLDYVTLDERLTAAVMPFLDETARDCLGDGRSRGERRLRIVYADGRFFTRSAREKYDFIFVDANNPSTAARNRYFTLEFLREARAALAEGGTLAVGMEASENLLFGVAGMQSASLYRTISGVFARVVVIPGETHYYFASDASGVVTADVAELSRRHLRRDVPAEYFHPAMFETLVQPLRLRELRETLKKKEGVRVNTDGNPAAYYYNLILWLSTLEAGNREMPGTAAFIGAAERRGKRFAAILLAALFGASAVWVAASRKSPKQRLQASALHSVFLCGATAMSLEMILLFGYQNLFGVLFERIGLVTGVFMLGIAGGGTLANALLKRGAPRLDAVRQAIAVHALFAVFACLAPFAMARLGAVALPGPAQLGFSAVVFLCGLLTGWIFPVACAMHLAGGGDEGEDAGRSAGWIDSFDHLGAAAGAFLAGAFLVPVFGVASVGWLLAGVNAGAAALLALHRVIGGKERVMGVG